MALLLCSSRNFIEHSPGAVSGLIHGSDRAWLAYQSSKISRKDREKFDPPNLPRAPLTGLRRGEGVVTAALENPHIPGGGRMDPPRRTASPRRSEVYPDDSVRACYKRVTNAC